LLRSEGVIAARVPTRTRDAARTAVDISLVTFGGLAMVALVADS
jgi:hypothetical protein